MLSGRVPVNVARIAARQFLSKTGPSNGTSKLEKLRNTAIGFGGSLLAGISITEDVKQVGSKIYNLTHTKLSSSKEEKK